MRIKKKKLAKVPTVYISLVPHFVLDLLQLFNSSKWVLRTNSICIKDFKSFISFLEQNFIMFKN